MKIKNLFVLIALSGLLQQACVAQNLKVGEALFVDQNNKTNCFFDNSEIFKLETSGIYVGGEVKSPGKIDYSKLSLHEVIVKETILENGEDKFIGAFRYIGYSLADILNLFELDKANAEVFPPLVDIYVEIENDAGEKVVVSWGEIYYSNNLDDILIATAVARVVPEKTLDMWELPKQSKLVIMDDLITVRNISSPSKITVKTYKNDDIEIIQGKSPVYSPTLNIIKGNEVIETLDSNIDLADSKTVHTVFYGKGRGLHGTKPTKGLSLKDVLIPYVEFDTNSLMNKLIIIVADDGYRNVYTWSEICNRNDQADILLLCDPNATDKGIFRLYPSCDFFSDRAIKGIDRIIFK
ncbi:MAG TPA: hypothetical protein PLL66_00415 [Bacteroidales bacterium]|nr:hypothetical protein [Bacteroidales bacterium]